MTTRLIAPRAMTLLPRPLVLTMLGQRFRSAASCQFATSRFSALPPAHALMITCRPLRLKPTPALSASLDRCSRHARQHEATTERESLQAIGRLDLQSKRRSVGENDETEQDAIAISNRA